MEEFWDRSAVGFTFLPDVSLLNDAAQYPSCDAGYIGSAVWEDATLNTATVAYYTGTTAGSSACFVCDEDSGYELNATIHERVCRHNGTWSGSMIMCGMFIFLCSRMITFCGALLAHNSYKLGSNILEKTLL